MKISNALEAEVEIVLLIEVGNLNLATQGRCEMSNYNFYEAEVLPRYLNVFNILYKSVLSSQCFFLH